MTASKNVPKLREDKRDSPYCSFKSDRDRLWALVSRDIRLVLIMAVVAFAGPPITSRAYQLWSLVSGA